MAAARFGLGFIQHDFPFRLAFRWHTVEDFDDGAGQAKGRNEVPVFGKPFDLFRHGKQERYRMPAPDHQRAGIAIGHESGV